MIFRLEIELRAKEAALGKLSVLVKEQRDLAQKVTDEVPNLGCFTPRPDVQSLLVKQWSAHKAYARFAEYMDFYLEMQEAIDDLKKDLELRKVCEY